ncbi:ABC transporter substrate-binding protein [Massiliimalia massiliensis]|uniref:ABC transporter substrate-binding protein n=1 Tax=Massiliimalia massiliensis TaxID=1852384 RepID=UPI00098470D2|nr:extracellular solute-binding protein [Massiliimalia massiliensis]
MKKALSLVLSAFMAAAVFTGCGDNANKDGQSQSTATGTLSGDMEIMHYMSGDGKLNAWDDFMNAFMEKHPDVTIESSGTDYSNFLTLLRTKAASSDMPDFWEATPMKVSDIIEAGKAMDLKAAGVIDELPLGEDVFAECVWGDGDEIWGAPYTLKSFALFYNQDLFDKHNVDVPTTQSEFLEACQKFSDAGIDPFIRANSDYTHLYVDLKTELVPRLQASGNGDYYAKLMSGEKKFADYDEFRISVDNMLTRYQWERLDDLSNDGTAAAEKFANGEAAMFVGMQSVVSQSFSTNPDFNLHCVPYPYSDDQTENHKIVVEMEDGWMISADTDIPEVCIEWLKYLYETPQAQRWSDDVGMIMVQSGLDTSKQYDYVQELTECYSNGKSAQNCIPQPIGEFVQKWRSYLQAWIADPNRSTDMLITEGQGVYDEIIASQN